MQQNNQVEGVSNKEILRDFINQSKARLQAILDQLQWTEEKVLESYNTNSEATTKNPFHAPKENEEPLLPESCATKNTVTISQADLQKLLNNEAAQIPQKFSDLQVNFSREQKLQIYEYVVERTEKNTEPQMELAALNSGNLTFAAIVALKKLETKKLRKYRTSKPTHIEEVRGLVDLQMQALEQYVETKQREERKRNRSRSKESMRIGKQSKSCERKEIRRKSSPSCSQNRNKTIDRSCSINQKKYRSYSKINNISQTYSPNRREDRDRSRSNNGRQEGSWNHSQNKKKDKYQSCSKSRRKYEDRSHSPFKREEREKIHSKNGGKDRRRNSSRDRRRRSRSINKRKDRSRSRSPRERKELSSSANRKNSKKHTRSRS